MKRGRSASSESLLAPIVASCPERVVLIMWSLVLAGAPLVLGKLVWTILLAHDMRSLPHDVSFVELFAGQKAVTTAMRRDGRIAISYELHDDPIFEDICSAPGFAHAVQSLLMMEPGAGLLSAIVCSSWTRLNAGTSGRKAFGWKSTLSVASSQAELLYSQVSVKSSLSYPKLA